MEDLSKENLTKAAEDKELEAFKADLKALMKKHPKFELGANLQYLPAGIMPVVVALRKTDENSTSEPVSPSEDTSTKEKE